YVGNNRRHAKEISLPDRTAPKPRARFNQKDSKAASFDKINDFLSESGINYTAKNRGGRATEEVNYRYPRSYSNTTTDSMARTGQSLRHLSLLLFEVGQQERISHRNVIPSGDEDYEMQSMIVENRLVVATNSDVTIDLIAASVKGSKATLMRLLQECPPSRYRGMEGIEDSERRSRAVAKIGLSLNGMRESNPVIDVLRSSGRVENVDVSQNSREELHGLLTGPRHRNAIVLLRTGAASRAHAEQKLMILIARSGLRPGEIGGDFAIHGRFRPCLGCLLPLDHLGRTHGLHHNHNPGLAYRVSFETVVRHLPHTARDPDGKVQDYIPHRLGQVVGPHRPLNYPAW
ncbi:MAG: hypothetical protein ACRC0L_04125, partial [Angustibacter sp.]